MKRYLLLVFMVMLTCSSVFAQTEEPMNADSLYFVARQYSIDGNYDESIRLSEDILEKYPAYWDVRILLARTYAWQNDFEAAVKNISQVLEQDPKHYDALDALIDFYFWSGDNQASLNTVDQALFYYPDDLNFLVKKAKIQLAYNQETEARQTISLLEELDPKNESLPLLKKGAGLHYSNMIRLEHYLDRYNQPYKRRWHMSSLAYGRRTNAGDYYAKVYVGDLIGEGEKLYSDGVGKQFSLECYPKIDRYNSMYVNYAWSPDALFPRHRIGLEYYRNFHNHVEISLGYRYMNFPVENSDDVNVHIATGSLARYLGKFRVSFRPYIVFSDSTTSYTWQINGRFYLPQEDSYLGVVLSTGVTPDDPYFYTSGQSIPDLNSWRVEMEWKQKLAAFLMLELQGGYENAEYTQGSRRDQFSLRTSVSFLF